MNNRYKSKIPLSLVKLLDTLHLGYCFFFKRKKKTTHHDFKEPFFIIGSGRSGNTLLRSMLVAGEEVSIPPESYVWPRIVRMYATYNYLPWEKLCSLIISEFEAYKEFYTWEVNLYKAHEKARNLPKHQQSLSYIINAIYATYQEERGEQGLVWGEKTPINTLFIDKIVKIFPKAKYIHIIREPKDVACSFIKAELKENYQEAAKFWSAYVKKANGLKNITPNEQYLKVRYEKLVSQPETELKKISVFLGISYTPKMLEFYKIKENLGDVKYEKHHHNIGKPVSTNSIGKWKEILSKQEQENIDNITKELFEKTIA